MIFYEKRCFDRTIVFFFFLSFFFFFFFFFFSVPHVNGQITRHLFKKSTGFVNVKTYLQTSKQGHSSVDIRTARSKLYFLVESPITQYRLDSTDNDFRITPVHTSFAKIPFLMTRLIHIKVREKSRECHNHKPQPFPDTKRKRKQTKPK